MPSATTIQLPGYVTGVFDFDPSDSVGPARTVWRNRDSSTSAGNELLATGLSPANGARKTNRAYLSYDMPIEHTVDGVVRVRDVARFRATFTLPETMTQAERDEFYARINAIRDKAVLNNVWWKLEAIYG